MYSKRVKILIAMGLFFLLIYLGRLIQLQFVAQSSVQEKIKELKLQQGSYKQLKTARGSILDRNGKILAEDIPEFQICIGYASACYLDERLRSAELLKADDSEACRRQMENRLDDLNQIIDRCTHFGPQRRHIEKRIANANDRIWNLRTFIAWARNEPNEGILKKYENKITNVPLSAAIDDFNSRFPNPQQRLLLILKVNDIDKMQEDIPLVGLNTDDDIFTAQVEFRDFNDVHILPKARRIYPYKSAAAQTIGWVSPVSLSEVNKRLFGDDKLSSYLEDDVRGQQPGVEYACEMLLHGRRGEVVYDIDGRLTEFDQPQMGKDITLTLDIELQGNIEDYLVNYNHAGYCTAGMSAVVINIEKSEILALVSLPNYDLNRTRYDYDKLLSDSNNPLINRAINAQYPPGSVVKPLILIAGLETDKITPSEIIHCRAEPAPKGWPNCWIFNKYESTGHDDQWPNNASNALKGSCNIYFSQLADRIEPRQLQQWLFRFGYGRKILDCPGAVEANKPDRELLQAQGQISNMRPTENITAFEQLPTLSENERRWFGIGQGNLRVTALQVANAMAAIARRGIYKSPRLFITDNNDVAVGESLGIKPQAMQVIRDGMYAVVNEQGGTAYSAFEGWYFKQQDVQVYGKTGSTEAPENAWFAGFAQDSAENGIAVAIVVEKGQSGAHDASPLARDIIQMCIDRGYIGKTIEKNN